jgi:GTP-binding protein
MEIKTAEFVKGIKGTNNILFDGIPEVAFIGRSNVGKSSTINYLLGRKSLVKTSSKPGKTKEINFFLVNSDTYFVDLPGYGFSRMSKKGSDKLNKHILWYLTDPDIKPKYVVVIIDAKVGLTEFDLETLSLLDEFDHRVLVVANKIDKLKKNDIRKRIDEIYKELPDKDIIPFSSKEKIGKEKLLSLIFS